MLPGVYDLLGYPGAPCYVVVNLAENCYAESVSPGLCPGTDLPTNNQFVDIS